MSEGQEQQETSDQASPVSRVKGKYYYIPNAKEVVQCGTQRELLKHFTDNDIDPEHALVLQGKPKQFSKQMEPRYVLN